MLTAFSRAHSRVKPAYICTACRISSVLGHGDAQLSHREQFSTSTKLSLRKRGIPGKTISESPKELELLRATLLAEERATAEEEKATAVRAKISTKPGTAKKHSTVSTNSPQPESVKSKKKLAGSGVNGAGKKKENLDQKVKRVADIHEGTTTSSTAQAQPAAKKKKKNVSKGTAGTTQTADETSATATANSNDDTKNSLSKKHASTHTPPRFKIKKHSAMNPGDKAGDTIIIRKLLSRGDAAAEQNVKAHFSRLDENISREELVKIIEHGDLSPTDTVKAVRRLRANLVRPISSTSTKDKGVRRVLTLKPETAAQPTISERSGKVAPTETPFDERIDLQGLKKYDSIKDGMQGRQDLTPTDYSPRARRSPSTDTNFHTGPLVKKGFQVESVSADELKLTPVEKIQEQVPSLSYGLERVLFNPGVYHLQDPRSRVFNFDPYLQKIMPVTEFDFNALKEYITSSRDTTLLKYTKEEKKKYTGSTSSMTAALAHFHFLLSQWRPINTALLSRDFPVESYSFTTLQKAPSSVFLRYRDGVYAIDADKQFDTPNILAMLGKSMEKLLTLPTEEFEKYRRENSHNITEGDRNEAETFNYTTIGDFLLRSQLDAYDPRLPGTGMFDLKTRAVVSIRMDTSEYEQGMGYQIKGRHGEWESYEREYYDMIRAAFLKYSLQVRMGRMDGIFVAFHNTQRIFGFQYISLAEMDLALHGSEDTTLGDSEFKISLDLLNQVLDKATEKYPKKSLRLHFETRKSGTPFMYIFAEPMEEEQVTEIQSTNHAQTAEWERRVLGLTDKSGEEALEEKKQAEWESLRARVEESVEKDELNINESRAIAETLLEESEYWDELSPKEKEDCIKALLQSSAFNEDDQSAEHGDFVPVDDIDGEDGDENLIDEDELEEYEDEEGEDDEDEEPQAAPELDTIAETTGDAETTEDLLTDKQVSGIAKETTTKDFSEVETVEDVIEDPATEDSEEPLVDKADISTISEPINDSDKKESQASDSVTGGSQDVADGDLDAAIPKASQEEKPTEVLAMTLTIRNKVNNEYVERPKDLSADDKWSVEYALAEVSDYKRATTLYEACKFRRLDAYKNAKKEDAAEDPSSWNNMYLNNLKKLSMKGKRWREEQDIFEAESGPKMVLGERIMERKEKE